MTLNADFLLALQAARRLKTAIRIGPGVPNRHKGIKLYPLRKPPTREQALALALHQTRRASRYLKNNDKDRVPPAHIREKFNTLRAIRQ